MWFEMPRWLANTIDQTGKPEGTIKIRLPVWRNRWSWRVPISNTFDKIRLSVVVGLYRSNCMYISQSFCVFSWSIYRRKLICIDLPRCFVSKRNRPRSVLWTGDCKIKQVQQLQYLSGKCFNRWRNIWHRNPKKHWDRNKIRFKC